MTLSRAIYVAANGIISFFLMVIFHCIYVPYLLFPFPFDGYLDCIHVLVIANSAAINMYPFRSCFSLDICSGVGLQGHMVALVLVFKGTSILFSVVPLPIYIHIYYIYIVYIVYMCVYIYVYIHIEFYGLFVYFGNKSLVGHIICKYFLPFFRLSLCFVYGFLCCAKPCEFD